MKGVVDRVAPVEHRTDLDSGVVVNPSHEAVELSEWPLRLAPPLRDDLPFQDDLRIRNAGNRDGDSRG